jgi:hypothetical protein
VSAIQQWLNALASLGPVDWAAAAVFVVLILGAFATFGHGWLASGRLFATYRDDRARTKAAIGGDHILPNLASLIAEVNAEVSQAVAGGSSFVSREALSDTDTLVSNLQWAGYIQHLDALSRLYAEYARLDGLFDGAVTWARRKGVSTGISGVALVVLGSRWSLAHSHIPDLITALAGIVMLLALGGAATCWVEESYLRNRLSRLFRTYE